MLPERIPGTWTGNGNSAGQLTRGHPPPYVPFAGPDQLALGGAGGFGGDKTFKPVATMCPRPYGTDHSSALLRLSATMSIARIITVGFVDALASFRQKPQHSAFEGLLGGPSAAAGHARRQHPVVAL